MSVMPDAAPNTVTSPEQQGVISLLNLARPSTDGSGALPLQSGVDKLMEVLMRGMANTRSENAAKIAGQDAVAGPTPVIKTKTTVDPVTGKQIHDIHYQGVQFGDAQAEVQKAYDGPQQSVAAALQPTPQQQIDAYIQEEAKRRHLDAPGVGGQFPPDLQQSVLDTFRGKYAAERKAGNGPIQALFNSAVMQALPQTWERSREEGLAKSSDAQRFDTALQYAKAELPVASEADRRRRLNEQQIKDEGISSRFDVRALRTTIAKTNFADTGSDKEAIAKAAGENGLDPANLQAWAVQRVKDKRAADIEAARTKTLQSFRKDSKALGQYPTLRAATESLGVPVKASELPGLSADYTAAREETMRTRQNELFKVRADARAAEAAGRSADASTRAAAAAERAAAKDTGKTVDAGALLGGRLTPDVLVSRRGNAKYDQDSVESAIAAGVEHFSSAINDRNARIQMNNELIATPLADGLTPDKALSARNLMTKAKGANRKLAADNKRDLAALNTLRGGPQAPPAQPVVQGTRGTVVNVGGKLVYQPH